MPLNLPQNILISMTPKIEEGGDMRLVALLTPSQARLHHILPPDAASVD